MTSMITEGKQDLRCCTGFPWTAEEDNLLRQHYHGKHRNRRTLEMLAGITGRRFVAVRYRVKKLNLVTVKRTWSREELGYLAEYYGVLPAAEVAKHLKRSVNALKIASYRKLGLNQRSNIYSASEVARLLGVDSHKVTRWAESGLVKATKGNLGCGYNRVWCFNEESIDALLKSQPWIIPDFHRMEISQFRSIVEAQWYKDPWFTCRKAAPRLGVTHPEAVKRYIRNGWLTAHRAPCTHGYFVLVIRRSEIDKFIQNDPRPAHRREALNQSRRKCLCHSNASNSQEISNTGPERESSMPFHRQRKRSGARCPAATPVGPQ